MDKTFKFEFTVEQTNVILASLGRMPYDSVAALVTEIQKQAQAQILELNMNAAGENSEKK